MDDIHHREKMPIFVGGTHYYVQSALWPDTTLAPPLSERPPLPFDINALNPAELRQKLKDIDPVMADRWNPGDLRKIRRSIQVFYETGRRHSDIIREQESQPRRARFRTLIFWLHSDLEKLGPRLNQRVDSMLNKGLMSELEALKNVFKEAPNYQRGAAQAIGFKEFHDVLYEGKEDRIADCIAAMKQNTRKYTKRQVQWIEHMMLPYCGPDVFVYKLDASDVSQWDHVVADRAQELTELFLSKKDEAMPVPLNAHTESVYQRSAVDSWQSHHCDVCDRTVHGEKEWQAHVKSRRHRKTKKLRNSSQWPYLQKIREQRQLENSQTN